MEALLLARVGVEYLLLGGAGLISLVSFVTLILAPALSSYGKLWEKTAASVLSLFVLAALMIVGAIVGLAVVYYYDELSKLFG